jgi:hypothetical protein
MDQNQAERLIEAVESIAASLAHINEQGLEVFNQSPLSVDATVSLPAGISITETPDDLLVKVINPTSYITGESKPFEIESI